MELSLIHMESISILQWHFFLQYINWALSVLSKLRNLHVHLKFRPMKSLLQTSTYLFIPKLKKWNMTWNPYSIDRGALLFSEKHCTYNLWKIHQSQDCLKKGNREGSKSFPMTIHSNMFLIPAKSICEYVSTWFPSIYLIHKSKMYSIQSAKIFEAKLTKKQ